MSGRRRGPGFGAPRQHPSEGRGLTALVACSNQKSGEPSEREEAHGARCMLGGGSCQLATRASLMPASHSPGKDIVCKLMRQRGRRGWRGWGSRRRRRKLETQGGCRTVRAIGRSRETASVREQEQPSTLDLFCLPVGLSHGTAADVC